MLTPIQCLNEIVSAVPNSERRFHVENELMGLDPTKAIAAQSFKGKLLVSEEGQDYETETECRFIEVFYEGGVNITTLMSEELKKQLFKDAQTADKPQEPDTANPYNPFNRRKGDINSWN